MHLREIKQEPEEKLPAYRGSRHPGDRHSVGDHPVVVRQGGQIGVGPPTGVEVGLWGQAGHPLQVALHCTDLQEDRDTVK